MQNNDFPEPVGPLIMHVKGVLNLRSSCKRRMQNDDLPEPVGPLVMHVKGVLNLRSSVIEVFSAAVLTSIYTTAIRPSLIYTRTGRSYCPSDAVA